jgi:hypothetical protein
MAKRRRQKRRKDPMDAPLRMIEGTQEMMVGMGGLMLGVGALGMLGGILKK